jgi:hypothetical protein
MPPFISMRKVPFPLLVLLLWPLLGMGQGIAASKAKDNIYVVGLNKKNWRVSVNLPGFHKNMDGLKPDGRRYLFASNGKTGVNVSITLQQVPEPATPQGCKAFLRGIVKDNGPLIKDTKFWESGDLALAAYTFKEIEGIDLGQRFFRACAAREDVYVDLNLSKVDFKPEDEPLFSAILDTFRFETTPAAGSTK